MCKAEVNEIWEVKIYLKREKKTTIENKQKRMKVVKSEWIQDSMIIMALLSPAGGLVIGPTNYQVMNRNIRNKLGDKFNIDHVYKLDKLKFLGKSQTKE